MFPILGKTVLIDQQAAIYRPIQPLIRLYRDLIQHRTMIPLGFCQHVLQALVICLNHRLFHPFHVLVFMWRGIFKAEEAEADESEREPVRFLPVNVQETPPAPLTIHLQDDLRIEVVPGFNPQLLQQVIEVLRSS